MTRSLSGDLRGRVIAAIEDWVSTREAARRFRIGISTAGAWYRRYRETGETEARKQGQPSRSKLDAHEAFILGLIEDAPDITLAEIGERLAAEHGVRAAPSTIWLFLDRRGITFKKDGARRRAAARRRPAPPHSLVRCPARPRSREADLHRRDRGLHKDGPVARQSAMRRAMPGGRSPRPLEDDDLHRRPAAVRHGGAEAARRPDERTSLPRLCRAGSRTRASARRHRGHGQSSGPQDRRRARGHREGRGAAPLPAAILAGFQSDRDGLLLAQDPPEKGRRQNHRRTLVRRRRLPLSVHNEECRHYFEAAGYDPE